MASLIGTIVDHFDNATTTADLTALRSLVDEMWADELPTANATGAAVTKPYIKVFEVSDSLLSQSKNLSSRVDRVLVQFDTWSTQRSVVGNVLEALENVYLRTILDDIDNRTMCGLPIKTMKQIFKEDSDIFHGLIEVAYTLQKSPV